MTAVQTFLFLNAASPLYPAVITAEAARCFLGITWLSPEEGLSGRKSVPNRSSASNLETLSLTPTLAIIKPVTHLQRTRGQFRQYSSPGLRLKTEDNTLFFCETAIAKLAP